MSVSYYKPTAFIGSEQHAQAQGTPAEPARPCMAMPRRQAKVNAALASLVSAPSTQQPTHTVSFLLLSSPIVNHASSAWRQLPTSVRDRKTSP